MPGGAWRCLPSNRKASGSPMSLSGVSLPRLFLSLKLSWNSEYRNSVTEHRPPFPVHLGLLAVAAGGTHRQILYALDPVGDGRCADADPHVIGPDLVAALGVEGHDVTVHFAGEHQIARGRQHAAEHQMVAG